MSEAESPAGPWLGAGNALQRSAAEYAAAGSSGTATAAVPPPPCASATVTPPWVTSSVARVAFVGAAALQATFRVRPS